MRIQLECDRKTARKVMDLHLAGRAHRESVDAAREAVWRHGRTPAGDPVFVGVTNGLPVHLLYDVQIHLDSTL
jgi:hypothetical protein